MRGLQRDGYEVWNGIGQDRTDGRSGGMGVEGGLLGLLHGIREGEGEREHGMISREPCLAWPCHAIPCHAILICRTPPLHPRTIMTGVPYHTDDIVYLHRSSSSDLHNQRQMSVRKDSGETDDGGGVDS